MSKIIKISELIKEAESDPHADTIDKKNDAKKSSTRESSSACLEVLNQQQIIFGGSFDPMHLGHISIIKQLRPYFQSIIIAPTSQNPWKNREATSLAKRIKMIELLSESTATNTSIDICEFEYTYSKDLLRFLRNSEKFNVFDRCSYWAIGSDSAEGVTNWDSFEQLNLVVVAVPIVVEIHSSDIRMDSSKAHPSLQAYINKHKLY